MGRKSTGLRIALLFAGVLLSAIAGAQQITISRDSKLLAEPNASASVVAEVKQGATGEVMAKKGAWVQVKSAEGTGWTFGFNVSYGGSAPAAAAPTPQRRGTTATIGIRGLEKEDLKNATFDAKQLDALDAFSGGAEDGDKGGSRKK
jgi:hypothetical protein